MARILTDTGLTQKTYAQLEKMFKAAEGTLFNFEAPMRVWGVGFGV